MPTTPKPLNQSTSNKKVTPHNFLFSLQNSFPKFQKGDQKFQNGGLKKNPPLKIKKMPITPKPLNQST